MTPTIDAALLLSFGAGSDLVCEAGLYDDPFICNTSDESIACKCIFYGVGNSLRDT